MHNHSFHISDEEDNEDAAEQRHGRSREDHHDHTSCRVDQSTEPHAHDDLSQLDHASEGGTVHSRTSRTFIASVQLQLLLEAQEVVGLLEKRRMAGRGKQESNIWKHQFQFNQRGCGKKHKQTAG